MEKVKLSPSQAEMLCQLLEWARRQGYHWLTDYSYRTHGFAGSAVLVTAWRELAKHAGIPCTIDEEK